VKARLLPVFFICLFALILSGCKTVDCGWHSYRFAKTRADVTQPNIPEKKTPEAKSLEAESATNNETTSLSRQSAMHLVGYSRSVTTSDDNYDSNTQLDIQPNTQCIEASHVPTSRSPSDQPIVAYTDYQDPSVPESVKNSGNADNTKFFDLPSDFPGGDATPLRLPRIDSGASATERMSMVDALFADLPKPNVTSIPFDNEGRVMTLTEFQDIALENNPTLRQAVARVEAARGAMIQAGLYPNPTFGYEGDTLGTADTSGYNGGFLTQQFVTAGKLGLSQNSAMMEMRAAEYDLRTTRIEVATAVRRLYFSILIEQERVRLYESIQAISDEVYQA